MSKDPLKPLDAPELVIGLVSPVGADLELIIDVLTTELQKVKYSSTLVRLSEILKEIPPIKGLLNYDNEEIRIKTHMEAGTTLREDFERGDILALFSLAKIRQIRNEITGSEKKPAERHAYILRSLKHKDEISALRKIYGKGFILISVFSPREERLKRLARSLAESNSDSDITKYRVAAESLISRDEDEEGKTLGQGVTDAFPLADFFVTANERADVQKSLSRFIEILFGHPFHTPSNDEFGMFQARSAALRSADLSRQVGACITLDNSEIISVGCNEVPKAFGGVYPDFPNNKDRRDFQLGYDSNSKMKASIIRETIERFKKEGWLSDEIKNLDTTNVTGELIDGSKKHILRGSQIMNLLEFGRVVHAEMNALMDAAKRGNKVEGSILYCTTFPCHMCARHILASGVKRVVYIEPYPKSISNDLYHHEIATEGDGHADGRVDFTPFVGVAPRRFHEFFDMPIRKDGRGNAVKWIADEACPAFERYIGSYIELETNVLNALPSMCEEVGFKLIRE